MEIWEIEKSDFLESHPEFQVSRPYMLWLQYLKLSPTMALAHKSCSTKKGLTEEEKLLLPDDFEQVIQIYHDFKLKGFFNHHFGVKDWWYQVAENPLGVKLAKPMVKKLYGITADETPETLQPIDALDSYLREEFDVQHKRGFGHLFLAIPMTGQKSDLLRQINEYLDFDTYKPPKSIIYGQYLMQGERIHLEPLKVGLRLLWLKSQTPDIRKWQLGLKASVSPKYSYLDPDIKNPSKEDKEAKRIIGITTDRALRRAIHVMENAARGRFPCKDPVEIPDMNWGELNRRLNVIKLGEKSHERKMLIIHKNYRMKRLNGNNF